MNALPLEDICNFLGYGNPTSRLWFVGGEEGFGGRMSEDEKIASLHARSVWAPIRDMHEAHLDFTEANEPIDISKPRSGSITVWLWMSRIALGLEGLSYPEAKRTSREYVYNRLGRSNGSTFLTEISPIPCARAQRPHPLVAHLARTPMAPRNSQLRKMRERANAIAICYGLGRREGFARMLGCEWEPMPSLHGAAHWDKGNRAFLLPFFGQGQMSHHMMEKFLWSPELRNAWGE